MRQKLIILAASLIGAPLCAGETINVAKSYGAEGVADWFYGAGKSKAEKKRLAVNLGQVNLQLASRTSCGKLVGTMGLSASLGDLTQQLSQVGDFFKGIFDKGNFDSLVFATICYYKPNVCAHIRHFGIALQEELAFQFDACQAMDSFIDSHSQRSARELQAKDYKDCLIKKASNGDLTPTQMRACEREARGQSKSLLRPMSDAVEGKQQQVMLSILQVIGKSENRDLWTSLLGEVHLMEDGQWVEAFPKGLLKPEDVAQNAFSDSERLACDLNRLRTVINSRPPNGGQRDLNQRVRQVIRERIPVKTAEDLESLPPADRIGACQSLGDAVAREALRELVAEGKSDLASALNNPNLPEDLKIFYRTKAEASFDAIQARTDSENSRSLPEILRMIARYGREFRSLNREKASEISRGRLSNSIQPGEECRDQFSCNKR